MRFVSLFSGIGGFELGFERAGMDCALWVEIDAKARKVLMHHWPNVVGLNDVRQVSGVDIRRVGGCDLICGGFPCQDVSVAGGRAGLDGARSGLFFEFARIIGDVHPTWIVLENVPGLLSSNDGRDMGTVLRTLGELGYGYAYRVLDARYTGVPQRRRRVFIVGHLGDWSAPAKVLLEPEGVFRHPRESNEEGAFTSALTANGLGGGGPDDNLAQGGHVLPALTTRCGNVQDDQQVGQLIPYRKVRRAQSTEDHESWDEDDYANTLNIFDLGMGHETQIVVSMYPETGQGADLKARVIEDDTAPALTCSDGDMHDRGTRVISEWGVRRLTPIECERLQGFPDDWTAGQADSNRYKQLGNAVATTCSEWIGRRIMEVHRAGDC